MKIFDTPFAVISAVVSRLTVVLVLIVTARVLPPDEFGVFALLITVIGLLNALVSGGGDMWLNRFSWRSTQLSNQAPYFWSVYLALSLGLALFVVTFFGAASYFIPDLAIYRGAIFAAIFVSALSGVTETGLAILRASGRVAVFFLFRDIVTPSLILVLILIANPATAAETFSIYLWVWIGIAACVFVFLGVRAPAILPIVNSRPRAWPQISRHSIGLIYGNLTSRSATYIDILALTFLISLIDLGEYRVAAQFSVGFMVVQHFIFLGLPWQLRQMGEITSPGLGYESVIARQRITLLLGLAGLAVLWTSGEWLLGLLGDRFTRSLDTFRLLLLVRFIDLLWGPQHEALVSQKLVIEDANANLMAIAVWILSFLIFFRTIDPISAAIASTAVSAFTGQFSRYFILSRHRIAPVFGHPLGPVLPGMGSLGVVLVLLIR